MQSFYDKYQKQGLEVILVTMETLDKVKGFFASKRATVPIAIDGKKETTSEYAIRAIPYVYLVNKVGIVVWQNFAGALGDEQLEILLKPPAKK